MSSKSSIEGSASTGVHPKTAREKATTRGAQTWRESYRVCIGWYLLQSAVVKSGLGTPIKRRLQTGGTKDRTDDRSNDEVEQPTVRLRTHLEANQIG